MMRKLIISLIFAQLITFSELAFSQKKAHQPDRQTHPVLQKIKETHSYSEIQLENLSKILSMSKYIGQGHPNATRHPVSKEMCLKEMSGKWVPGENSQCKDRFMVPISGPDTIKETKKTVCIDQFEFPNIPCEYPVIWTRANEAHQICQSIGKRLCDADEWEQACAGYPREQPYLFSESSLNISDAHKHQREKLNGSRKKIWAYGPKQDHSRCATNSQKSPTCDKAIQSNGKVWSSCGSNTYPSGYFSECKSSYGVYDMHGNAAEHMNLPLQEDQQTKSGGTGVVEMKGSWFIFAKYSAHPDDCFWRAPFWHGTRLENPKSHHNYHLGFRCCKSI